MNVGLTCATQFLSGLGVSRCSYRAYVGVGREVGSFSDGSWPKLFGSPWNPGLLKGLGVEWARSPKDVQLRFEVCWVPHTKTEE